MIRFIMPRGTGVLFICFIFAGNAFAASDMVGTLQGHLYAGEAKQAASVARSQLAETPKDAQAQFALGAIQFLLAVEHLGQGLHRFGLNSDYENVVLGLGGLPFLRLPIPKNDNPDKATYEGLRGLLANFVRDLGEAEATLRALSSDEVDLPLNIGLIRLDLNGDGKGTDDEALWRLFAAVASAPWLDEQVAAKLLIDFDGSDVPWLRAYCHLLIAIAEFPLAYDWREAFETTFHDVFPKAGLPLSALLDEANQAAREKRVSAYASFGSIADLIAFVHLTHWSVVEPERLEHVLTNLQGMVLLSRENWTRILAETDNRNEWIPNLGQTSGLPRMVVRPEQIQGWQRFLEEFDAVLDGRKLVPHWRFDKGVNLRRFFLEPRPFDIVLMIQGSGAVPYLEEGDLSSAATWMLIMRLFAGDFFRYFMWFN